jgi:type VI secretion system Hcp family effector
MALYLDIANFAGESESPNPNWKGKIEIFSMDYDIHQKASAQVGSGMVASAAEFHPMTITKVMDKSTPLLFAQLASGQMITTPVTIRNSRPGATAVSGSATGGLYEAESYVLTNVTIKSYATSGTPGPGGLPLESWSFSFTAITENYQTVDASGNLKAPMSQSYDVAGGVGAQIQ